MADKWPQFWCDRNVAEITSGKASGAIALGAPVILAAAISSDGELTFSTTTTLGDPATYGVYVGKVGHIAAAAVDGDKILVCRRGPAKVKVNGATVNIAAGDWLEASTSAGIAVKLTAPGAGVIKAVLARAFQASTADGDFILVFVQPQVNSG